MNKESFISSITYGLDRMKGALEKAKSLEQGKIYEFDYSNGILGLVKGFSFGEMSCGVSIEILASQGRTWGNNSFTISLYQHLKITPVPYIDLPKYLGWNVTATYTNRLKNINRYIKKGL
jgi:hypothetical protein